MSELVTTGTWLVNPGQSADFIEEWMRFAQWAATRPGARMLRLGNDVANPLRFVSFAPWRDSEAVHAWKSAPEFRERFARALQYVDLFEPAELDVVAFASAGAHDEIA